jgi:hypothetical protein
MSDQSSGSSAPASFRKLLPALKPSPASDSVAPSLPQRHYDFKKRRQAAACEPCREHKTKVRALDHHYFQDVGQHGFNGFNGFNGAGTTFHSKHTDMLWLLFSVMEADRLV